MSPDTCARCPETSQSVGVAGLEPTAPRSQSECATKLRHTPVTERSVYGWTTAAEIRRRFMAGARRYDVRAPGQRPHPDRGRSSVAESQSSKLNTRVRFPSPAPCEFQRSPPRTRLYTACPLASCRASGSRRPTSARTGHATTLPPHSPPSSTPEGWLAAENRLTASPNWTPPASRAAATAEPSHWPPTQTSPSRLTAEVCGC